MEIDIFKKVNIIVKPNAYREELSGLTHFRSQSMTLLVILCRIGRPSKFFHCFVQSSDSWDKGASKRMAAVLLVLVEPLKEEETRKRGAKGRQYSTSCIFQRFVGISTRYFS